MLPVQEESDCLYQGRPEGAVRKCHRLSMKADYHETCDNFQAAVACHQQASQALQSYLKTQISVSTRRQVELLIRRHQSRIFYLRRREEERNEQLRSRHDPATASYSAAAAEDDSARFYYSHNPAMLQDMKKSQVQFSNAMEILHKLTDPRDLTKEISKCSLLNQVTDTKPSGDEAAQNKTDADASNCGAGSTDCSAEGSTTTERCCASSGVSSLCRKCSKSLEYRLKEEESLMKVASDLPLVWRTKDRMLHTIFADCCRMTKARDALKDQVQQLTSQLQIARCHVNTTVLSYTNCSDLSTSDGQDICESQDGGQSTSGISHRYDTATALGSTSFSLTSSVSPDSRSGGANITQKSSKFVDSVVNSSVVSGKDSLNNVTLYSSFDQFDSQTKPSDSGEDFFVPVGLLSTNSRTEF